MLYVDYTDLHVHMGLPPTLLLHERQHLTIVIFETVA